jgi:hypothetical protein
MSAKIEFILIASLVVGSTSLALAQHDDTMKVYPNGTVRWQGDTWQSGTLRLRNGINRVERDDELARRAMPLPYDSAPLISGAGN